MRPRSLDELLREAEAALRAHADRQAILTFRKIAAAHRDPSRFRARIEEAERDLTTAQHGVVRLAREIEQLGAAETANRLRDAVAAEARS